MIPILHSVVAEIEKFITELWELAIAQKVSEKNQIVKPISATILQSILNRKYDQNNFVRGYLKFLK
jgi:hypothetical protein